MDELDEIINVIELVRTTNKKDWNFNKKKIKKMIQRLINSEVDKRILSLKAIEDVLQSCHLEDEFYGNDKKRCEQLIEQTRNKIGYSKKDLKNDKGIICRNHRSD